MLRTIAVAYLAFGLMAGLAMAQDVDKNMGNWEGKFTQKEWKDKPVTAKVIAMASPRYRAVVSVPGKDGKNVEVILLGEAKGEKVPFSGTIDLGSSCKIELTIAKDKLHGKISGKNAPGAFDMTRVEKKPPTLGAQPPAGAVVLFDGKNLDAWQVGKVPWALVEGGAMEVREGNIFSKQEFGDCKFHVEFRTPFMPAASGQARGNSGVYIQGRYEIQVLDSFGLPPKDNECGGIYKKATPKVNATLPPTEWQTYDIVFHAPKYDESGKKVKNAVIRVEHNGIVILDNVELDGTTPGGVSGEENKTGPLLLQEHHCKVQYRNVWAQPL